MRQKVEIKVGQVWEETRASIEMGRYWTIVHLRQVIVRAAGGRYVEAEVVQSCKAKDSAGQVFEGRKPGFIVTKLESSFRKSFWLVSEPKTKE